jgi:hypothetical protein
MKPKEKAKELVSKFNFEHTGDSYTIFQNVDESKRCALIAVDEIILSHNKGKDGIDIELFSYWQDVQIEILNL